VKKHLAYFLYFLSLIGARAQEPIIQGQFLSDSIRIGEPTPFVLTAAYDTNQDLIFPDSTFDFTPFELSQKLFFPSVLRSDKVFDSAIYYITSFEVDSIQSFSLPVFLQGQRVINNRYHFSKLYRVGQRSERDAVSSFQQEYG
jgi:hypothetical protein